MEVKVNVIGRRVYFEVLHPEALSDETLKQVQKDKGYHPDGYGFGFPEIKYDQTRDTWIHKWDCWTSCD